MHVEEPVKRTTNGEWGEDGTGAEKLNTDEGPGGMRTTSHV